MPIPRTILSYVVLLGEKNKYIYSENERNNELIDLVKIRNLDKAKKYSVSVRAC